MSTKLIFFESIDILGTIPNYHTLLFVFVIIRIIWFFIKKKYQSENNNNIDECIRKLEEWRPEPLTLEIKKDHPSLNPKKITSNVGKIIIIDDRVCLNLGTHRYLDLTESNVIEQKAVESIEKYGVGSCGPRGFYGTVDIHLNLEERLAKFMEMEEAVVYSYGFTTIASAIPAYCKRKDMIFVDEKVNFSIQKGLDASRSNINYFKHNDVNDLEKLLKAQKDLNKTNSQGVETNRKFLIVEGIYMNTGTICPLPELVVLCRKYKLRIFVDESISFGILGANGRGVTEHFNIPRHEIDMIMGLFKINFNILFLNRL
jgi:serine palmitoyltransferase